MQIFAHYHLLNSPSPRVYYSIQVTTHAQKDVPSNNTYNIDSYPISSYKMNFHVRRYCRQISVGSQEDIREGALNAPPPGQARVNSKIIIKKRVNILPMLILKYSATLEQVQWMTSYFLDWRKLYST